MKYPSFLRGKRSQKLTGVTVRARKFSILWLFLSAVLGSLLLAEVGLRLLFPAVRLSYSHAGFSPRYHHASPEFLALLEHIRANPAAFKGDITVAILGDSFVAGAEVDSSQRFTSIMQHDFDALPAPRIKIINLGFVSYSTVVYERLYRDVVLPLDPDIVIVCLDQTDVADDHLYEQEMPSSHGPGAASGNSDFKDTILSNYESHPITFFLLRHSRLFLQVNMTKQSITGSGFIPERKAHLQIRQRVREHARDALKQRLYLETCKDPASHRDLFENSEKYIRSISLMKPQRQRLCFVTY